MNRLVNRWVKTMNEESRAEGTESSPERRSQRLPLSLPLTARVSGKGSGRRIETFTVNISPTGFYLHVPTHIQIEVGDDLEIELMLPQAAAGGQQERAFFSGKVIRVDPTADAWLKGVAVKSSEPLKIDPA